MHRQWPITSGVNVRPLHQDSLAQSSAQKQEDSSRFSDFPHSHAYWDQWNQTINRPTPLAFPENIHTKKRLSCNRLEICLLCVIILLVGILCALCTVWLIVFDGMRIIKNGYAEWHHDHKARDQFSSLASDYGAIHNEQKVCTSQQCVKIAALLASNMNTKFDQCDDFYQYTCGNYPMHNDLAADQLVRHPFLDAQSLLHKQIRKLLETESTNEKMWESQTRSYYRKCIDEDTTSRDGILALNKLLGELGDWPLLNGNEWKEFSEKWEEFLFRVINKTAVTSIILEISVGHNPKNSTETVIEIGKPKFGSQTSKFTKTNNTNYFDLIHQTAKRLGINKTIDSEEVHDVVNFENKLTDFAFDEPMSMNRKHYEEQLQVWQLKETFPDIGFEKLIQSLFNDQFNMMPNDTVILRDMEYFRQLQTFLKTTKKRTLANYVIWRVIQNYSLFLPAADRLPFYQFHANETKTNDLVAPQRWEDCVSLTLTLFDLPLGRMFVENYLDEKFSITKVAEVVSYLKLAFLELLNSEEWLDKRTKERAIDKLNSLRHETAYPAILFNDNWLEAQWPNTVARRDEELLQFTIRIRRQRVAREWKRLGRSATSTFFSPAETGALYIPHENKMIFPAGLQFPFLSKGLPNFIIYSKLGAIAAHELSHAFCSEGIQFDEKGNLNDWFETKTAKTFADRAECFVRQYEAKNNEETRMNARSTLPENIADNSGIKIAYKAYTIWKKASSNLEPALPGFQNFTTDQMFWISYANNWCSMTNSKFGNLVFYNDVHAPPKLRALIPLMNLAQFSSSFHCAIGTTMNPTEKCSVW
ncbi:putative zinc metalloproteinase [Aphelenchoides besseyi]|nr:putative zinc metalloproteinase [Aphelenchoides besseyi]KAI6199636.1 putative zinc metalloproteinase [Aphelenchoides besseyi]